MIFLTVGTQKFQFNRLLAAVDLLVEKRLIREPVIAQTGCSTYRPRNFEAVDFMEKENFEMAVRQCSLLITHGGVGTILSGLGAQKKIIVVPRRKAFGEHVDDHQMEIAERFEKMGYLRVCWKMGDLLSCYESMETFTCRSLEADFSETARFINQYLGWIE
ncbi:MAG: glycosyl transferase [Firmicutes bacterium]|nr:glycosyl transferase [Bacillota bacterium]